MPAHSTVASTVRTSGGRSSYAKGSGSQTGQACAVRTTWDCRDRRFVLDRVVVTV
jgi:hypothetical protein